MTRIILALALLALTIAGCAVFYGPDCNMGVLSALSHPFHACDASGD